MIAKKKKKIIFGKTVQFADNEIVTRRQMRQ